MTSTETQKAIWDILDKLTSDSYEEIVSGIVCLGVYLKSYSASVRDCHKSFRTDTKLASLRSLQETFQYNLTIGLCQAYGYFAKYPEKVDDCVLMMSNDLLTGILLIHPESRALFGRGQNMALILSFLDSDIRRYSESVYISFLSLLIHILLKNTKNLRSFETNDGCRILIHHLHVDSTRYAQNGLDLINDGSVSEGLLIFKIIEFLLFYLTDETDVAKLSPNHDIDILTVEEKAELFRPNFPGIDNLIESLQDLNSIRSVHSNIQN